MKFFLLLFIFSTSLFSKDIIAVYRLNHVVGETLPEPGINEILSKEKVRRLNFMQLLSCMNYCVSKDDVKAVVIYPEGMRLGLAQKQELNRRIQEVKKAGKQVYLYAYGLNETTLPLAQSTQVSLFPQGDVSFRGIAMQQFYFKGLLDKLGLQADIIHIGDYKSAGEPFYLSGPSQEAAKQQQTLGEQIFEEITADCAVGERKSAAEYAKLIDKGLFSPEEALEANLVDSLEYHNDFIKRLKKQYGDAKFKRNYGLPKSFEAPQIKNMMDAFSFLQKLSAPKKEAKGDVIALVNLDGTIEAVMAEKLRRYILRAAQNDKVKAMVLRINSPGGSALASEVICHATKVFKDAGKVFVVSMANVAASGGYYAAVYGEPIFAENATITGSIGVIGGKMVTSSLLEKIGISTHQVKIGKFSDLHSTTSFFDEAQREVVTESMLRVYDVFKQRVSEGRKDKLKGELESMAGGRVFTGRRAKELGLVDKIGGLREAIREAQDQASLAKYRLEVYPKQLSFEEMILESFQPQKEEEELISMAPMQRLSYKNIFLNKMIAGMEIHSPELALHIGKFLQYINLLQSQNVLLLDPRWAH
ncbi:signal peptide peptidase SppA [Lentisphaera profundi]|uniref:Signal peptide peptidase SppA n=1 Tax=Lentisphaera profundi TaxID=1658616 RepID=A0ABY7VWC3_9BACT|nr:signal peptide peptidase SppA [Lentisphaera profundi]WDE98520.1 signal peptide peptidase SppA [Lentisphaera profundi]